MLECVNFKLVYIFNVHYLRILTKTAISHGTMMSTQCTKNKKTIFLNKQLIAS